MEHINLDEYEIIHEPVPEGETPREFLLRMTGRDYPELIVNGVDLTWQEVQELGMMPLLTRIVGLSTKPPRLLLRKKSKEGL